MRIGNGIGQLRMTGDICDEYSMTSLRPYPYKSEEMLIDEGEVTNLNPPWSDDAYAMSGWPGYVKAPPIPSLEREIYPIHRGMRRLRWNKAGPWNLNRPKGEELTGLGISWPDYMETILKRGFTASELAVGGVLSGAGIFAAIGAYRAIDKQPKMLWKIALGVGVGVLVLPALGFIATLATLASGSKDKTA